VGETAECSAVDVDWVLWEKVHLRATPVDVENTESTLLKRES